jgi:hypothetical protein
MTILWATPAKTRLGFLNIKAPRNAELLLCVIETLNLVVGAVSDGIHQGY